MRTRTARGLRCHQTFTFVTCGGSPARLRTKR
jgi:hypothetical protein